MSEIFFPLEENFVCSRHRVVSSIYLRILSIIYAYWAFLFIVIWKKKPENFQVVISYFPTSAL